MSRALASSSIALLFTCLPGAAWAEPEDGAAAPSVAAPTDVPAIEEHAPLALAPTPPPEVKCPLERYVLVTDGPVPLDAELTREVATELAAELAERGLGVCREAGEATPAAVVALSRNEKRVLIDIDDRHTDKRISRNLAVSALPEDGRALAVAVAIDELLRASWAELLLRESEPPSVRKRARGARRPAPSRDLDDDGEDEVVRVALDDDTAHGALRDSPWSMTASLFYQYASRDWDAWGGAVRGFYEPAAPLRVGGGLHAYHAQRVSDELGSIAATGIGLDLSLGACIGRHVRLCGDARGSLDYLAFDGRGARGQAPDILDQVGAPLLGELVLGAQWPRTGTLFGAAEVSAGYVLHGVEAMSGGRSTIGLSGALLGASLSLGVRP